MSNFAKLGRHIFDLDKLVRFSRETSPDGVSYVEVFIEGGGNIWFNGDDARIAIEWCEEVAQKRNADAGHGPF